MKKKFPTLKRSSIILVGIFAALIPSIAPADWTITSIGNSNGIYIPTGINNSGQVVGYSNREAFITGPNGVGITDLGTLGGTYSYTFDINDSGQVAGYSSITGDVTDHAFITGPNGIGMTDISGPGGAFTQAYGINNSGQVVGLDDTGGRHAFITGPNGVGITSLGTFGGTYSIALGINNLGQVVAVADPPFPSPHPELMPYLLGFVTGVNGTGITSLETLGGISTYATGINDSGQVVGWSQTNQLVGGSSFTADEFSTHAFITGPNGLGMIDLGTFGGVLSRATAINNIGEVVGVAGIPNIGPEWGKGYTPDNITHGFFYSDGLMTDLSLLPAVIAGGWTGLSPVDINDRGQIVGVGSNGGFLLSYSSEPTAVVPEPSTYTMVLAGLGLIGFMTLRRRQGHNLRFFSIK